MKPGLQWSQIDDGIILCPGIIIGNTQTAIFEVSPMERTHCLEPFPNWDSRRAVTWGFPVLFESGCWSKSNLMMYALLFLSLFSFNISILKVSQIIL